MARTKSQPKKKPVVYGEYGLTGYEVWSEGQIVYRASNHKQDSTQPAMSEEERLPLKTIRQLCIQSAREIADERGGVYRGVERVAENKLDSD